MAGGAQAKEALAEYNRRRDFTRTPEPSGEAGADSGDDQRRFIVQKHDASRLHWDLRLEMDGVLKSWAVTKGPSLDPDTKRLAVRTEDHPLSYAGFEGTIPEDEYGGGTVMLWDRGTWEPVEGKKASDIEDGHLHFRLKGERMKGEWLLVRMRAKKGESRENWLLRKIEDDHAGGEDTLVRNALTSIATGRDMDAIAAGEAVRGPRQAEGGSSARRPGFREPQLARLVDAVPPGNGWMHEIKFDGYRLLIAAKGDDVRIYTRSGKDWTDRFGALAQSIAALDLPACLIDGEAVANGEDGNPDFSALQSALSDGEAGARRIEFHAFDLIEVDGRDITDEPNIERKERLEALIGRAGAPIHCADHVIGAGEKLLQAMCDAGQEGIISKRVDARYSEGRSSNWLKVKCTMRQEFVIVGWSASSAKGRPFASLAMAQHSDGKLVYRGKVGTGFAEEDFDHLAPLLDRLSRKTAPLDISASEAKGLNWVTPKLVAEIAFAEFTGEGRIRHGSYLGLREDKDAAAVVTEDPSPAPSGAEEVAISSRDRVIFPSSGATKGDLADYYAAMAPVMLPFLANRPVSLVRCPQGRAKECFFQKHDTGGFGDAVRSVPIREKDGELEDYLYLSDARGVLQCVQMGTIEFHLWGAPTGDVEAPDRLVFDLDPDEGLDFEDVKRAARDIRDSLSEMGLTSFAMLTGGKGVHVIVPLLAGHDWDAHGDFARRLAEALSLAEPDRFTATMSKAKREGRIFIDWLRNRRGSTAIAPYSARAREGAPVAVPLAWNELRDCGSAADFTIGDAERLLSRARSKSLSGWGFAEQRLPDL